jgi:hypothetical protein
VHLPCVCVTEAADLEVDDDEALQASMEKNQIDPEPGVVESQPPLPAHERKIVAQFQQKVCEVLDQSRLEFRLGILVADVEKLEHERVADRFLRREVITLLNLGRFLEESRLVARQCQPLIELAADLAIELTDRPALAQCLRFVESAPSRRLHGKQAHVGGPWQSEASSERQIIRRERHPCTDVFRGRGFSRRCLDIIERGQFSRHRLENFRLGPCKVKSSHAGQIGLAEPAPETTGQIRSQPCNQRLPVASTGLAALFATDNAPPDFPISCRHDGIDAASRRAPGAPCGGRDAQLPHPKITINTLKITGQRSI